MLDNDSQSHLIWHDNFKIVSLRLNIPRDEIGYHKLEKICMFTDLLIRLFTCTLFGLNCPEINLLSIHKSAL